MSKPNPLLAHLKRTTEQAQHGGNVVSLPIPVIERQEPAITKPTNSPGNDSEMDVMLAALDGLLSQEQAETPGASGAAEPTPSRVSTSAGPAQATAAPAPSLAPTGSAAKAAAGSMTASQAIDYVNLTHFVAPLSGESTIYREGVDPETGAYSVVPVSQASFRLEFAPIKVGVNTANGIRTMSIADIWLRTYP